MDESNEIEFTDTCPTCKGRMAKGNRYCSLACYTLGQGVLK